MAGFPHLEQFLPWFVMGSGPGLSLPLPERSSGMIDIRREMGLETDHVRRLLE